MRAVRHRGARLEAQVDAKRFSPCGRGSLNLHADVQEPAPARVLAERAGAQFVVAQAVAVPQAELVAGENNLPSLVFRRALLERNPAERALRRLGVRHAPIEPRLFELLAADRVFLAHLLSRRAADQHVVALAESGRELLEIESAQPLVAFADGSAAGFVNEIPDLIDLTRHPAEHAGVLVLDSQLEGLDCFHTPKYIGRPWIASCGRCAGLRGNPGRVQRGGVLWSPSYGYFAASCAGAPISILRQYIQQQQAPPA